MEKRLVLFDQCIDAQFVSPVTGPGGYDGLLPYQGLGRPGGDGGESPPGPLHPGGLRLWRQLQRGQHAGPAANRRRRAAPSPVRTRANSLTPRRTHTLRNSPGDIAGRGGKVRTRAVTHTPPNSPGDMAGEGRKCEDTGGNSHPAELTPCGTHPGTWRGRGGKMRTRAQCPRISKFWWEVTPLGYYFSPLSR